MSKKIFSLVLFLALVITPSVSHAGFFDMFKFRANLQAAIGSKASVDLSMYQGYKQGDKGGSIAEAQDQLLKLGYFNQPESSGYFDLDTEVAVMKFQKDNGLEVNGRLNKETLSVLLSGDDRGGNPSFTIQVKALLGGAYNTATGMMNSALNDTGLIPLIEPYTGLGYNFVGGGEEETTPSVFNATGNNAIVDWVVLELRNPTDIYETIYSRAALIQADGDIVDVDGISPVSVETNFSEYYVAVMHRNHLGVISANWFGTSEAVDLTSENLYGGATAAKLVAPDKRVMWPGDVNADSKVKYTGLANDRDEILLVVGSSTPNTVVPGYLMADVDLNGQVAYTGSQNDRDLLLQTVGGSTPNNVISSGLPEHACMMSEFVSNDVEMDTDSIQFEITFDVTATSAEDCGDVSLDSSTENNNGVDVNGQGVAYTVGTSIQTPQATGFLICVTGCQSVAGGYMINEGETGRFKLTVVANSLEHGEFYDLAMHSINWRNGSVATNADQFYRANLGYTSVYSTQPIFYP